MSVDEHLVSCVRNAARDHRRALVRVDETRTNRNRTIIEALDGGVSERVVAAAAGLRKGNIFHIRSRWTS